MATQSQGMGVGRIESFVRRLGPTWLAGAIAAGPATMASLLAAAAGFGYTLLWIVVISAILGTVGQYLAMRLGLLTEAGLVSVVEAHLGSFWAWALVGNVILASGLAQIIIMKTLADVSAAMAASAGISALADPRIWGITWAVILVAGLAGGGYRIAEFGAKLIVSLVLLAFVASLFFVPVDSAAAVGGLVPAVPEGGALLAAGILGGGVHITLLTMQSYTMRARGWTERDTDIAIFDVLSSMLVAFGVFSLAVFIVGATVLPAEGLAPDAVDALVAAEALGPFAGANAFWLFFAGLLGAAVSTLGGNTLVPPYVLADKLGWERSVEDPRYRGAIVVVALASAVGAFIEGAFFPLLALVLAFGLVATPFVLALILYLLNDPDVVGETNSVAANLGGLVVFGVAALLASDFVRDELATVTEPISAIVVAFAVVNTLAIGGLVVKYVRER